MQGRNGDSAIENRLVDTGGEGVNEMNEESSIDIYTLPWVKQITVEKLSHNKGSLDWRSLMT